jgi:beta-fructofuranosidase
MSHTSKGSPVVFLPTDHLLWDFWFAPRRPGEPYHLFYLQAPRKLPDPEQRHSIATVGHAVSTDLVHWAEKSTALVPDRLGSWDDRAIWTGSIVERDGRYYWFYTAINQRDRVQRIGLVTSTYPDLDQWERHPENPLLEADSRWYEKVDPAGGQWEACRDPWIMADPSDGTWWMFFTARANNGPSDGRGVIGCARSSDLVQWEQLPPVIESGEFGELEVPQVFALSGRWYMLFCTAKHSATRLARRGLDSDWFGTHYLVADAFTGPYELLADDALVGDAPGTFYAGRVVEDPDGKLVFIAWRRLDDDGRFLGALSDPAPVELLPGGRFHVHAGALWPKDLAANAVYNGRIP